MEIQQILNIFYIFFISPSALLPQPVYQLVTHHRNGNFGYIPNMKNIQFCDKSCFTYLNCYTLRLNS